MDRKAVATILSFWMMVSCNRSYERSMIPQGLRLASTNAAESVIGPVDWRESVGIFIGIGAFHSDLQVRWAPDDATDLAYIFIRRLRLLAPDRSVLLISGEPGKESSRQYLAELRRSTEVIADDDVRGTCLNGKTIASIISRRAGTVGIHGILILFIATHGVSVSGQQTLLTADASRTQPKCVVLARIMDAVQSASPGRLLLLVDACRETLGPEGERIRQAIETSEPLDDANMHIPFATLNSASPGSLSYARDGNGLFTTAILEGLQCGASAPDGFVTLSALDAYVSRRVRALSDGFQQPEGRFAGLGSLPLVDCGRRPRLIAANEGEPQPAEGALPEVRSPKQGQRIGAEGDENCPRKTGPCSEISAEGWVPRERFPFFAVQPLMSSGTWIQPLIRSVRSDGTFSGRVFLGDATHGPGEKFKIFVYACRSADRFAEGQQLGAPPTDCDVSEEVEVYRER